MVLGMPFADVGGSILESIDSEIFSFLTSLLPIHEKISALVLQLPPSLTFDEAKPRLEEMFDILPNDFVYPIEGRHESWFTDKALNYFKQKKHCLIWNVVEGVNNPFPITSDYLYVRGSPPAASFADCYRCIREYMFTRMFSNFY